MEFETIKWELQENGIGILTLNRPDKLNAMSFQMIKELHELLDNLMVNLDCRVIIFRGEGITFGAGLDLKESMILQKKKKPQEINEKTYLLNAPQRYIIKAKI